MELNLKLGNAELSISNREYIYRFGFWAAIVSFVAVVGYDVVQLLQIAGAFSHPLDEILIYGTSLGIAIPFMIAVLALHYVTPTEKRFWTHGALLFSVMYATYVTLMYVVQLSAVLPYTITDPVLLVTPHSLFWTFDALGYITMGLAALFIFPVFLNQGPYKWARYFFLAHGLVTPLISIVYFAPTFSTTLLMLGLPWAITAPGAILLLALYFKRQNTLPLEV